MIFLAPFPGKGLTTDTWPKIPLQKIHNDCLAENAEAAGLGILLMPTQLGDLMSRFKMICIWIPSDSLNSTLQFSSCFPNDKHASTPLFLMVWPHNPDSDSVTPGGDSHYDDEDGRSCGRWSHATTMSLSGRLKA